MASKWKETRIERWLVELSEHLKGGGWRAHLGYDDRFRGARLVASLQAPTHTRSAFGDGRQNTHSQGVDDYRGHCELQLRRTRRGAVITLFAPRSETVEGLSAAIDGLHRGVRRIDNAKRKFFHRIERMAIHLRATFAIRAKAFPTAQFEKLTGLFPDAHALVGLMVRFHEKGEAKAETDALVTEGADGRLVRQMRRYQTCFAAGVRTGDHFRAAPYLPEEGFRFRGDALNTLRAALSDNPSSHELDFAIANRTDRGRGPLREDKGTEMSDVAAEVSSYNCESACCEVPGCHTPDCDWIDLPDCDWIDLPDCGGCDVLDCSF